MLRFVVPERGETRDSFMRSYCEASGWYTDNPNKAMGPASEIDRYKRVFGVGQQDEMDVVV